MFLKMCEIAFLMYFFTGRPEAYSFREFHGSVRNSTDLMTDSKSHLSSLLLN